MTDPFAAQQSNIPELSVSEVSDQIGRTLKTAFGRIRVRGEITRMTDHRSGHLYMTLTDAGAAIDSVCWRGNRRRLSIRPEDGMEVICTGSISTFAPRSKYQLVIERMELAGEGALLKLLEDRRRRLLAEGLFDPDRKQPIPFMPQVIGIVTSPTGSVIRDILHRLTDRFPVHVLLWPVLVQGTGAKEQIAAAINGFNLIDARRDSPIPRPDLLIVARGGGSLEDLWPFNEEEVVRAAAASTIPLISAVGHETDTTLIDFASDRRAPTPTAAAEFAVPVRNDLLAQVMDDDRRLFNTVSRMVSERRNHLDGLSRGLGDPEALIEARVQTIDFHEQRLDAALAQGLDRRALVTARLADRLPRPEARLESMNGRLAVCAERLRTAGQIRVERNSAALAGIAARLRLEPIVRTVDQSEINLNRAKRQLASGIERVMSDVNSRFDGLVRLLHTVSHERILERGFVLVRDQAGEVVSKVGQVRTGQQVSIQFGDGETNAVIGSSGPRRRPREEGADPGTQGDLF